MTGISSDRERLTAESWPVAASMLSFPPEDAGGRSHGTIDARWAASLAEVAEAGFTVVDVTDTWVRPGDLPQFRLEQLWRAAHGANVTLASISVIRRSVIDAIQGGENLAYSHRTIDAAAVLGVRVVSVGLHQALTSAQRSQLWFWTVPGHRDDPADGEMWALAVRRLRELGRHAAELGVLLSLEMYEDTYLGTADSAVRLVEEIDLPNVGLNPDTANLIRLHRPIEPWSDVLATTLPWTNFWHVKNYQRDEDAATNSYFSVPTLMESGLIDYRWAVREALKHGFQGVIVTENYGGDALSICAANREYLVRRILPKTPDYDLGTSRVLQPKLHDSGVLR